MKQEDKELLLKDISARLPYGVKVNADYITFKRYGKLFSINNNEELTLSPENGYSFDVAIERCKPFLFPMSYIDDNEKLFAEYITTLTYDSNTHSAAPTIKTFDFYNKYHIDYSGLIPMGLAIDATGLKISELNIY